MDSSHRDWNMIRYLLLKEKSKVPAKQRKDIPLNTYPLSPISSFSASSKWFLKDISSYYPGHFLTSHYLLLKTFPPGFHLLFWSRSPSAHHGAPSHQTKWTQFRPYIMWNLTTFWYNLLLPHFRNSCFPWFPWIHLPLVFMYLSSPFGYLQNQDYTLASILLPTWSYPILPYLIGIPHHLSSHANCVCWHLLFLNHYSLFLIYYWLLSFITCKSLKFILHFLSIRLLF